MTCLTHQWWFPTSCPACTNEARCPSTGYDNQTEEDTENGPTPSGSDNPQSPEPTVPLCVVGPLDDPPFLQRHPDGSWKYPELTPGEPNVFISGFGWAKAS